MSAYLDFSFKEAIAIVINPSIMLKFKDKEAPKNKKNYRTVMMLFLQESS